MGQAFYGGDQSKRLKKEAISIGVEAHMLLARLKEGLESLGLLEAHKERLVKNMLFLKHEVFELKPAADIEGRLRSGQVRFQRDPQNEADDVAIARLIKGKNAEIERLREFAKTVVAMCVPMDPPADNPVPEVIASVLLHLANAALGKQEEGPA